jgi:hypothetical protein
MEAICSSETSADTQRTTRRHIPDGTLLETNHFTTRFAAFELTGCSSCRHVAY